RLHTGGRRRRWHAGGPHPVCTSRAREEHGEREETARPKGDPHTSSYLFVPLRLVPLDKPSQFTTTVSPSIALLPRFAVYRPSGIPFVHAGARAHRDAAGIPHRPPTFATLLPVRHNRRSVRAGRPRRAGSPTARRRRDRRHSADRSPTLRERRDR